MLITEVYLISHNPNSLLNFQHFNRYQIENNFQYNSRNWITSLDNNLGQFSFSNTYFKNGNLNTQLLYGTYRDYMQNRFNLNYKYSNDYNNRLLSAQNINQGDNTYSTYNTYYKDGNITTLKRYGDNNTLKDDFNYQYYPNTNKIKLVTGAVDQFSFDLNGNTILDDINGNYDIKYDYRNLITELYHKDPASETRPNTYATRYYYDESGNRVRKFVYVNSQVDPPPITDWSNPGTAWVLLNNEFYVKGADGKDLATYQGNVLEEWFVWGNDVVGKIKRDTAYYYYKDHLGSVRVVVDNTGAIVAGYDYDAWGYPLENRNYNGDSIKFKYTGKELDKESFYDYFGARYYDSRIGRWGTVDPSLDKYLNLTPYNYSLNNPLVIIDPDGEDPRREFLGTINDVVHILERSTLDEGGNISLIGLHKQFGEEKGRFLFTEKAGIIDMKHFLASAYYGEAAGYLETIFSGISLEYKQKILNEKSAFAPEDPYSNDLGAKYGISFSKNSSINVSELINFLQELVIIDPTDPRIGRDKLYIPEGENPEVLSKRTVFQYIFAEPFYGMNPYNTKLELKNLP